MFPVFITVTVNAVFQIFFCNIQIFCNFIFVFTTMFIGSDQTEQSDASIVSPEPCLTLLFSIAGIFHVDNITDGSVVVTELLCQNTGFFCSCMAKEARKMLADEDINIPDELVMNLVAEDADGTKAAVEAFSTMYKEAVQNAVKDALKGKPPKAGNGGDKPSMTKDQILAVKNPSERQKLIAENITLFQ